MVYYDANNKKREERLIELIAGITDLNIDQVKTAIMKNGIKEVFDNPALISEEAVEKINDLKFVLDFMSEDSLLNGWVGTGNIR